MSTINSAHKLQRVSGSSNIQPALDPDLLKNNKNRNQSEFILAPIPALVALGCAPYASTSKIKLDHSQEITVKNDSIETAKVPSGGYIYVNAILAKSHSSFLIRRLKEDGSRQDIMVDLAEGQKIEYRYQVDSTSEASKATSLTAFEFVSGILANEYTLDGVTYPKGSEIYLNNDGYFVIY